MLFRSGSSGSFEGSVSSGVELLHHGAVLEGVLLGFVVELDGSADGTEFALDLIGVDNSGKVGAFHGGTVKLESSLGFGGSVVSAEETVKSVESSGGEDNESSNVTTGSKHEEVKSVDVARVNTGEVARVLGNVGVIISVNDERSFTDGETRVSHFTLTVSHLLGVTDS